MGRSLSRELTFKLLYSMEIQEESSEEQTKMFIEVNEIEDDKVKKYIEETVNGVNINKQEILKKISENLKSKWEIDRISKIDLVILELAIYEILFKKLPYKIAINEAVELAKVYGEDASPAFINGVLASIVKKVNSENGESINEN